MNTLKGIHVIARPRKDGTIARVYYHRATRKRLRGEPGSPEFIADFQAAEQFHPRFERNTLAGLIDRFAGSAEFGELAVTTRSEYTRKLRIISARFGALPIELLEARTLRGDVLDWRDKIAKTSGKREADNLVGALARVLSWALDRGAINTNVLTNVSHLYRSNRADKIWTPGHIRIWMQAAPANLQTAMLLALGTAQRRGDLVKMRWSQYDGQTIRLVQGKTGAVVEIPAVSYLRDHLDALERSSDYILTNRLNEPWTSNGLGHAFMDISRAVGITDLHMHDLRGTAVTMLADAGATTPQIAAMTGHSLDGVSRILKAYLKPTLTQARGAVLALDKTGFDPRGLA